MWAALRQPVRLGRVRREARDAVFLDETAQFTIFEDPSMEVVQPNRLTGGGQVAQ
jgi:hypothetical protein